VSAAWLEETVWADCRNFIRNPGMALDEARRQLQARTAHVAQMGVERERTLRALGEKATERERVLMLFRRGRASLQDAESQLDDIAKEEAELRQQLTAMDAQKTLAEAYETHLMDASLLLHRLQDRVATTDQTSDLATKRQVIELLVHRIRIDTQDQGQWTATITYAFTSHRVAVSSSPPAPGTPR
jgi:hypothetical protein